MLCIHLPWPWRVWEECVALLAGYQVCGIMYYCCGGMSFFFYFFFPCETSQYYKKKNVKYYCATFTSSIQSLDLLNERDQFILYHCYVLIELDYVKIEYMLKECVCVCVYLII